MARDGYKLLIAAIQNDGTNVERVDVDVEKLIFWCNGKPTRLG